MSNISVFQNAGLPSVQSLAEGLRSIKAAVGAEGAVILKMDKTGHWVFGADQTEVEDGSYWAINPYSFIHGYIAWGDGEALGEKTVPVSQPLPELDPAPPGAKRGWEVQVGMSLKCMSGEDKNMEARYATTSVGGKRAVQQLALAIAEQVDKDPSRCVPVVTLGKEHYMHKSYGRIYTPVFKIVEWMSLEGPTEDAAAPAASEEPARRRRS